jgi:hypothetical protein
MRTFILKSVCCSVLALSSLSACTADIHDNTADVHDNNANIEDAQVSIESSSDMDNVQPGQVVHLEIKAEDVFLIEPTETPPADRVKVAGHFSIFLDSTSSTALLVTAKESVDVTIPASTSMGNHKLVCQVDKHDGTATQVTSEIELTVVAKTGG